MTRWVMSVVVVGLLILESGCAGGTERTGSTGSAPPETNSSTGSAPAPGPSESEPAATGPEPTSCPDGGRFIPAVVIPPVRSAPIQVPDRTVGGETIPGFTIPGVDIPGDRVPAQCVDIPPAPGGCLSAVSIPPVTIPAVEIPAVEIPGVTAGGINTKPVRAEAVRAEAVHTSGVSTPEVCQPEPPRGGVAPRVVRPRVVRPRIVRPMIVRPRIVRPRVCNGTDCIPAVAVPSVLVKSVAVSSVAVESASIASRRVGQTDVLEGDDSIAFSINADVLFDFDKADIKPAAAAELRRVAQAVKAQIPPGATITVDGHTDAKGDDAYNQELSERRAAAVADWLASHGGVARSRFRTTGYGENKPVAPNTRSDGSDDPDGRAKNRRVVIAASR